MLRGVFCGVDSVDVLQVLRSNLRHSPLEGLGFWLEYVMLTLGKCYANIINHSSCVQVKLTKLRSFLFWLYRIQRSRTQQTWYGAVRCYPKQSNDVRIPTQLSPDLWTLCLDVVIESDR